MALKKVKGTLERVLDKNLQDLVRGIRNHKENEVRLGVDFGLLLVDDVLYVHTLVLITLVLSV